MKTIYNRCTEKGCQIFHSICQNNNFFTYKDKNGKCNSGLNLCDVVEYKMGNIFLLFLLL